MKRASLLLLAVVLVAPHAAAHAEPYESMPGSGERLAESPDEVVVAFTERVYDEGSWIEVWDLSGNRVDRGDLRVTHGENPVMRISVPPLDDGPYLVKWQTYSQTDGHTIQGAIGFSVGGFAPPESQTSTDKVPVVAGFARALVYLGYVAAVGAFAFRWMVLRRDVAPEQQQILDGTVMAGAGLHFVGIVWLMFDTASRTGIGLVPFLTSSGGLDLWIRFLIAAALVLLTALWWYGPVRPRSARPIVAGLWVAAVAAGARFGHGESAAAWFVQTVHGVSIAAWLGGLFMLLAFLLLASREPKERKHAMEARKLGIRFGTLAITSVTAMAVTGFALALTIVGASLFDPQLWTDNAWRTFLTIKILLVLVMIFLAGVNRQVFLAKEEDVGPLRRGFRRFADRWMRWQPITKEGGTSDFRKVVATEAVFGVAVLVCAGFLMSVAAPAEGLESSAATYETTGAGREFTGLLRTTPEPASGHFSDIRVYIQDLDEQPLTENTCIGEGEVRDDCVRLTWQPTGANESARQEVIGIPEEEGWWLFENVLWTTSGDHDVVVQVSTRYVFNDGIPMTVEVLRSESGDGNATSGET